MGKRFDRDGARVQLKGVTYGTFARRADGARYPEPDRIEWDLTHMAARGLNALRLYTPPPPDLLEVADDLALALFVAIDEPGLQIDPPTTRGGRRRLRDAGRQAVEELGERCAGHPSVVGVSVGNEVPVDVVRFIGARAVEALLSDRVRAVHETLPDVLVTYVNFPTTEFLEPEDLDFLSFNVFLESPSQLRRYLAHLQVLARGRPLVISELGLAGDVEGEAAQAESLAWQLRSLDEAGCAGGFVFSWTDEWAVADVPVEGWGFGLTRVDRTPKAALKVVQDWCQADGVRSARGAWPRMSVVVCAYNEETTIEDCLRAACTLDYPDLEVIVCDDGSTDRTVELARRFPVRLLELPHGGLSKARNAGWKAATGDIIAYLDADAYPDQDWLHLLAMSFEPGVAVSGGPNLPVPGSPLVERAVATSPGGPREVLLEPSRAEHVPGCNLAIRRDVLEEVGGFNPLYTAAGDDVDLCWRIIDLGWEIGFAPAAQIFHHRRDTVRGYLRQQRNYGRAERLVAAEHPQRFNRLGNARWHGFLYGDSRLLPRWLRPVVYTGWAGSAPFQPIAERRTELAAAWMGAMLPLSTAVGLSASLLAVMWPALWVLPALVVLGSISYGLCIALAVPVSWREPEPVMLRLLVGFLHVAQPLVRAWARLTGPRPPPPSLPASDWTGNRMAWLADLRRRLELVQGLRVWVGGPRTSWDIAVRNLGLVTALVTTATLWGWEPRWRVTVRPRGIGVTAVGAMLLAAAALRSVLLSTAVVTAVVATVIDWIQIRRVVRTNILASIAGAEKEGGAP
ncbi:MAG: glycosyltransferase [Actinomycetota bacterium]|nr:glycosyltransferase [Actinomycetota bacterium]